MKAWQSHDHCMSGMNHKQLVLKCSMEGKACMWSYRVSSGTRQGLAYFQLERSISRRRRAVKIPSARSKLSRFLQPDPKVNSENTSLGALTLAHWVEEKTLYTPGTHNPTTPVGAGALHCKCIHFKENYFDHVYVCSCSYMWVQCLWKP